MMNKTVLKILVALISWALIVQTVPQASAEDVAPTSKHFKSLPSDTFGILHVKDFPKAISDAKSSMLFKAASRELGPDLTPTMTKCRMRWELGRHFADES